MFKSMPQKVWDFESVANDLRDSPELARAVEAAVRNGSLLPKPDRFPLHMWENYLNDGVRRELQSRFDAALAARDSKGCRAYARRLSRSGGFDLSPPRWRRRELALEKSGARIAAEDFDRIVFDLLEPTDALQRTRRWLDEATDGALLALAGGVGVGKTVAAAWAAAEASGAVVRSDELTFLAGSNYSADRDRFCDLAQKRGLLVVDDVGTERDESKARHALFDLTDIRQGRGMRTLLTTNLSAAALRERLCPRTLSRIRSMGGMYSCAGEDLRVSR